MRLRYKIPLILLSTALVLLVGVYLAFFQFGLLEYMVNRKLQNMIGQNLPVKVQIGRISGDYYSRLVLLNLDVSYDDGSNDYTMAYIPRLTIEYSLSNLWRGDLIFQSIEMDSAAFKLVKTADKKWLIPRPPGESVQKGGTLNFEIKELRLRNLSLNLLMPGDTLRFSDCSLKGAVQSSENTYSANIDSLNYSSSDRRFGLKSASGKITLTGDNLMLQDFQVVTDSSELKASGQAILSPSLQWQAVIEAPALNLAEAFSFLKIKLRGKISVLGDIKYRDDVISGKVTLTGTFEEHYFDSLNTDFRFHNNRLEFDTLDGTILGGCGLQGKGGIDFSKQPEEYHLRGEVRGFNLEGLVRDSYKSNLNGRIDLSGQGFSSESLSLDIIADLDESWFDRYHPYQATGIMNITTRGIQLQDEFVVSYHENTFFVAGNLEYSGDINVTGTARFENLSAFNGQTFMERMGGRADAVFEITGALKNPSIAGQLRSDSLWLYDVYSRKANIDFDVKHFLYDRNGTVLVHLDSGAAYKFPFDSLHLNMDVDSQFVFIKSADIRNRFSGLGGKGILDYLSYPQKLDFNKVAVDMMGLTLHNDSSVVFSIDSSGYDILRCRLLRPIGYIRGAGRINYDESMDFNIDLEKIDIVPLIKLVADTFQFSGALSGKSHIGGTFASPLMSFQGRIDSLIYEKLLLGDLLADFDYSEKNILIDSVTLDSHTGYYVARGTFPIDLSFQEVADRFPDAEQNIAITARDTRLDAVTLFLEEVESFKGDLKADFKLTGTPRKPKVDGRISLENGILKPYELALPLERLRVAMRMVNQTVYLEEIAAECSDKERNNGKVSGGGQIVINSIDQFKYGLKIKVEDFPARYELGDVSAVVDADLSVEGITPPTVRGDVTIRSALYRENFAKETDGWTILTSLQGDKTWDLNLNADIASNLWIKNDDIDAEFSGKLNFIREKGNYRYIGTLEILRGKGFMADRVFRIEPGGTINYEDIEYPNPRLDIYASTKIRGAATSQSGATTEAPTYDLRVHITGTLEEPIISAAEGSGGGPQFTNEEIIPLIFTDYYQAGSNKLKAGTDRLTTGISGFLSGQMAQIGSRTLGVETFEIDPVYGDKFNPLGTRLTVGFYTHPNLYIYGRSSISGVAGQEVGFEYRLKRFLLVEGRRDQENLYHLLLNFYWDY
ncbi:MAG: translocation/assembly module TamB domain-containing protein [candidate division Zixibacteria bacterium]|nr:translocation/assembly module TamB domain-containing protein [candidate division Zixibacteria bacterium]